jgi:hypothetical protein
LEGGSWLVSSLDGGGKGARAEATEIATINAAAKRPNLNLKRILIPLSLTLTLTLTFYPALTYDCQVTPLKSYSAV